MHGTSVAVAGDIAALGGPGDNDVQIFRREGQEVWGLEKWLFASDSEEGDNFGGAVALSGNRLAVGAPNDDHSGLTDAGSVYIFERQPNGDWIEVEKIMSPIPAQRALFGFALDLEGDWLLVGAPDDTSAGPSLGNADLFKFHHGEWVWARRLTPIEGGHRFGWSVSMDGDRIAVGAPFATVDGIEEVGAVYFFEAIDGSWREVNRVEPPDPVMLDLFGASVGIRGDMAIVGVPLDDFSDFTDAGSAYIYEFDGSTWREEQMIVASQPWHFSNFGEVVLIHDDAVIVGEPRNETQSGFSHGFAHVFRQSKAGWEHAHRLEPSDRASDFGHLFGQSLAADDDTLLVGAPRDSENGFAAGAAYVFDLECGEFAMLNSISVAFGSHIAGGLNRILESDDLYYRSRSSPGFTATEPNLIELRINATAAGTAAPLTIDLIIESRLNQPGGTARVRLRDWAAGPNQFQTVHTYALGTQEKTEFIENVPEAGDYIRAADGRMQLSLRQSVFATFSALGFESLLDFVSIEVEE